MIKLNKCLGKIFLFYILLSSSNFVFGQSFIQTSPIFDEKSMKGWEVFPEENKVLWKIQDSVFVGGDEEFKIDENNYLYTTDHFEDFEFRCLFKLTGDSSTGLINSGIQYRSQIINGNMVGYQADIGEGYWGDIYDEHRRGKLVSGYLGSLTYVLNEEGWNSYIIRCKGNFHELYINGVKTAEYEEMDQSIPKSGLIGIQLHSGGKAKIELRDLTITDLTRE